MRYYPSSAIRICSFCIALFALLSAPVANSVTLQEVIDNGGVICGVTTGETGFSAPDDQNQWHGMEVDICKAVALAVFGSPDDEHYVLTPLTESERLAAVDSGDVHVLAAKTHWDWEKSVDYNLDMIGPYFYDGQGFMVRNSKGINSIWKMQNVSVCVIGSSVDELVVRRFMKRLKFHISLSLFDNVDDMLIAFDEGACDAVSADITLLSDMRRRLRNPLSVQLLPQLLNQKPIGLLVSEKDSEWSQLVDRIFSALVQAEELGLTSRNIARAKEEGSVLQKTFIAFGEDERFKTFSDSNWIVDIVSTYGNYGEIFSRNFGSQSATPYPRGANRLWFIGGLMAATPLYTPENFPDSDK